MELASRLDFTETVKPICMPHFASREFKNTDATIAGWGKQGTQETGSSSYYNTKLKEAPVKIWTPKFCSDTMAKEFGVRQAWHTVKE